MPVAPAHLPAPRQEGIYREKITQIREKSRPYGRHAANMYAIPANNPVQGTGDQLPSGSDLSGQATMAAVQPNSGGALPNPPTHTKVVTGYRSSATAVRARTPAQRARDAGPIPQEPLHASITRAATPRGRRASSKQPRPNMPPPAPRGGVREQPL